MERAKGEQDTICAIAWWSDVNIRCLANTLAWKVMRPLKSSLYHVYFICACTNSGPKLSQDWVAYSDSLARAAEDAFYVIRSLYLSVWIIIEPQKYDFLFLLFLSFFLSFFLQSVSWVSMALLLSSTFNFHYRYKGDPFVGLFVLYFCSCGY
jgi:hypothetical protein